MSKKTNKDKESDILIDFINDYSMQISDNDADVERIYAICAEVINEKQRHELK